MVVIDIGNQLCVALISFLIMIYGGQDTIILKISILLLRLEAGINLI